MPCSRAKCWSGQLGVVHAAERQPAGVELGFGAVRALVATAEGGGLVGAAGIAGLQRRDHQLLAQFPHPRLPILVGQGGRQARDQRQRAGGVAAPLRRQRQLVGDTRRVLQAVGNLSRHAALADRHPRLGQQLLVGREVGQQSAGRIALRSIEQHVLAGGIVVGRQHRAEPAHHGLLRADVERLGAPDVADDLGGVLGIAGGLVGGGERHRAFGRRRIGAGETSR